EEMVAELERGRDAVYSAQEWVGYRDGVATPKGGLSANRLITGECIGRVDLLQVMWRTSVLERLEPPYFPEDPRDESCRIQDGLFFNRLCEVTDGLHPVNQTLSTHRFTPESTYSPI